MSPLRREGTPSPSVAILTESVPAVATNWLQTGRLPGFMARRRADKALSLFGLGKAGERIRTADLLITNGASGHTGTNESRKAPRKSGQRDRRVGPSWGFSAPVLGQISDRPYPRTRVREHVATAGGEGVAAMPLARGRLPEKGSERLMADQLVHPNRLPAQRNSLPVREMSEPRCAA